MPETQLYGPPHIQAQPAAWWTRFEGAPTPDQAGYGWNAYREQWAAEGATREIGQAAQSAWDRANMFASIKADNDLSESSSQMLDSFMSKQGQAAMAASGPTMDAYRAQVSKISQNLANPVQKIMFGRLAAQRSFIFNRIVARHAATETNRFEAQTMGNAVQNAQAQAAQNWSDPQIIKASLDQSDAAMLAWAKGGDNGTPGSARMEPTDPSFKAMMLKAHSRIHASVIRNMAENGHTDAAQVYFKKNASDMEPQDSSAVQNLIRARMPLDVGSGTYADFSDPTLTLAGGFVDRQAMADEINHRSDLDPEQKVRAIGVADALANQMESANHRNNQARTQAFLQQVTPALNNKVTPDQLYKMADQNVALLPNGTPDEYDRQQKYDFINTQLLPTKGIPDIDFTNDLFSKVENGQVTTLGPINEALAQGKISKTAAAQMGRKIATGSTAAMKEVWKQIGSRAAGDFPISEQRNQFINALRTEWEEHPGADPNALQDLYNQRIKPIKSGAPGIWSRLSLGLIPTQSDERGIQMAAQLQQNPDFVSAAGGTQRAIEVSQAMGGPDNFKPGSRFSNAAIYLRMGGFQVSPQTIQEVIKQNPKVDFANEDPRKLWDRTARPIKTASNP